MKHRSRRVLSSLCAASLLLSAALPLAARAEQLTAATPESAQTEPAGSARTDPPAPAGEGSAPAGENAEPQADAAAPQAAPISQAYQNWLADGRQSIAPAPEDRSYLTDAWALLLGIGADGSTTQDVLPSSFDLRTQGIVSSVRSQQNYGTCWSHSSLSTLESSLRKSGVSAATLSVAHLAWYGNASLELLSTIRSSTEFQEIYGSLSPEAIYNDPGRRMNAAFNFGAFSSTASGSLTSWIGPVDELDMPYDDVLALPSAEDERYQEACAALAARWESEGLADRASYHVQNTYVMAPSVNSTLNGQNAVVNHTIVKTMLLRYGSMDVCYYAGTDRSSNYFVNTKTGGSNHAVTLVGWDDNFPKEKFSEYCRPRKDGAWLLRNSWGTDYADCGYFRISYEDASLCASPILTAESCENYDYIHQLETTGWGTSVAADSFSDAANASRTAYMANFSPPAKKARLWKPWASTPLTPAPPTK